MNEILLILLIVYALSMAIYLSFSIAWNDEIKDVPHEEKIPYWLPFVPVINTVASIIIMIKILFVHVLDPIYRLIKRKK